MTAMEIGTADLHRRAYEIAWHEFSSLCNLMTPDEKRSGPNRLRWYIEVVVETGGSGKNSKGMHRHAARI
jgi:hypothetical protein